MESSKKYLIDESEKWAAQHLTGRPMNAKEVEVLDIVEVSKELYVITGISIASIPQITDYLKAKNFLIVKIKD